MYQFRPIFNEYMVPILIYIYTSFQIYIYVINFISTQRVTNHPQFTSYFWCGVAERLGAATGNQFKRIADRSSKKGNEGCIEFWPFINYKWLL